MNKVKHPKLDTEFLKQLPQWEADYKQSDELVICYTPEDWKTAAAEFSEHELRILGEPVMEDWEEPYMRVLADIATENGGAVLEVGYGMGISARFIQQAKIRKHIVIEANHDVANKARDWARICKIETEVLEGLWQEAILLIPDESLDGILFDTYPLTEKELYQNHFSFFSHAFAKLRKGGVLTYYSDEPECFSEIHIKRLIEAGFLKGRIAGTVVEVSPPENCEAGYPLNASRLYRLCFPPTMCRYVAGVAAADCSMRR
jgi:guanidinoacetate N-methyltransferase